MAVHRSSLVKAFFLTAAAFHSSLGLAQSSPASTTAGSGAAVPVANEGSFYLQCDGNPNNMTAGESLARIIALSAVIGLLAPSPEQPDAGKRKFGQAGVDACSQLIDGEKAEGNVHRRIPLILARALHRVEALDYPGALADVVNARGEAEARGLTGDPYFQLSMGLSLDLIEGEVRARLGDIAGARDVSLRNSERHPFNFYGMRTGRTYESLSPDVDQRSIAHYARFGKLVVRYFWDEIDLLSRAGRFEEASNIAHALLEETNTLFTDGATPSHYAQVAITDALAGRWDSAADLAGRGRDMMRQRAAEGNPDKEASSTIERLDLYDVLRLIHDGDLKQARRNFGARSEWVVPSLGQVLAVHKLLSAGIADAERAGMLSRTADQILQTQQDTAKAVMLESDKNNRTLFTLILPYADRGAFESLSKQVWNTKGNRILGKDLVKDTQVHLLSLPNGSAMTQYDALLLHAALQAKARGKQGLLFFTTLSDPRLAFVHFANPDDPGVSPYRYMVADEVIASLRAVIPSPQELAARKKAR